MAVFAFCDSAGELHPPLHRLERVTPDDQAPLRGAITQLLLGVTPREADAGFGSSFSSFNAGTLRSASIKDGVATLDFTRGWETTNNFSTTGMSVAVLDLIDATVFQFPEITGLEIQIEGKRWCGFEAGHCEASRSRRFRR